VIGETVYKGNLSKVVKLYDDLYFRTGDLEVRDQCNCGFVDLGSCAAIIDYPGQDPADELIDEAEKVIGKRVKYILITHAHIDHITGFRTLKRRDVSIVAAREAITRLREEAYILPKIERSVVEGGSLILEGFEFRLERPAGRAHSPGDLLIGIPKYKLVFTGDLVVPQKYMFFHSSSITGWRRVIHDLQRRDWQNLAMGHGFVADASYLKDVSGYLGLLSRAKELLVEEEVPIDELTVARGSSYLSSELRAVIDSLLEVVDAKNVARQVGQLVIRTEEGF
jgi:glyoxylase-like metal-dependent hydrolase (beta-lactamase superfamily II)